MTFHYRVHGAPDGLPMLLLHGSFGSSRWWEPFLELLPDEIYAIAPDLRGCGQSHPQPGSNAPDASMSAFSTDAHCLQIAEQMLDVHSFVKALGWRNFDLVGHSSGGAIAIEFALHHGELLNSLTLVERRQLPGMPADRADIIVAGAAALAFAMETLGVHNVTVSTRNLRYGVVNELHELPDSFHRGPFVVAMHSRCLFDAGRRAPRAGGHSS